MNLKESKLLFRAFSDETRLRILALLNKGELCVCDVMSVLKQPQSKISRHFSYLKKAGLVTARKEGLWMYYRLSSHPSRIRKALSQVLKVAIGDLDELRKDASGLSRKKKILVACCP